ncbi:MAG: hypothetical protein IH600_04160 [Bacteroidetes bacterium]|nr:hypothetical protein [Bacteroidota bacterium]
MLRPYTTSEYFSNLWSAAADAPAQRSGILRTVSARGTNPDAKCLNVKNTLPYYPYYPSMRLLLIITLLAFPILLFAQNSKDGKSAADDTRALLGPRVGSVIDSTERVYFNLFPTLD